MIRIDAHNHIDIKQTADILVRRLNKFGIDKTIVMPNPLNTVERIEEPNNLIFESMEKYPERFIGFCCANPRFKDDAVQEVERCFNFGFKGFGEIVADAWSLSADDETIVSLLASVKKFNLPILFHSSDTPNSYPKIIEKVVSLFPTTSIVIGHMGTWNRLAEDAIAVAKRHENVYLETSTIESTRMIQKAIDEVGAERVLFGSDSFTDEEMEKELKKIIMLNLSEKDKKLIMGENAAKLLDLASIGFVKQRKYNT